MLKYLFIFISLFLIAPSVQASASLIFSDSFETFNTDSSWYTVGALTKPVRSSDFHTLGDYSVKFDSMSAQGVVRDLTMPTGDWFITYSIKRLPYSPYTMAGLITGFYNKESGDTCHVKLGVFSDTDFHEVYLMYDASQSQLLYKYDDLPFQEVNMTSMHCEKNLTQLYFYFSNGSQRAYVDNYQVYSGIPSAYDPGDWSQEYYQLASGRPDINLPIQTVCFLNKDCNVPFSFNTEAIDSTLYVIPPNQLEIEPNYDKVLVYDSINLSQDFVLASTTATTTTSMDFCGLLVKGDYVLLKCGLKVSFVDESEYDFDFLNDDPCLTVSTSTGSFADDFRYGLECGFRRAVYWLFKPSTSALQSLSSSKQVLMSSFPFSIYNDVNAIISSSTSPVATGTPVATYGDLINNSSYDTIEYELLDTAQISKNLGNAFFKDKVYTTILYFLYSLAFFYIIIRVYKIIKSGQEV